MKKTNMEHFRGEAEEKKYDFGKRKDPSTGKEYLISCVGVNCQRCDFCTGNNMDDDLFNCVARKIKWLMSEYKPEPVLNEREKGFIECVETGWLARDKDNELNWYEIEPRKDGFNGWWDEYVAGATEINKDLFPFITWEDEESWAVEELRKLKVQE